MKEQLIKNIEELIEAAKDANADSIATYILLELDGTEREETLDDIINMKNLLAK